MGAGAAWVAAGAMFLAGAAPAQGAGAFTRSVAVRDGLTKIYLRVPHRTGSRPPAILLSVRPHRGKCSASGFIYQAIEAAGRMRVRLRCAGLAHGARAVFLFRGPYVRHFRLTDGAGVLRIKVDKPPGDVRPLGSLEARPEGVDCTAYPGKPVITSSSFSASVRIACGDLPNNARGTLAIGGLLAGQAPRATSASIAPAHSRAPTVTARPAYVSCHPELNFTLVGITVLEAQFCVGKKRTIGRWETLRIPQDVDRRCPTSTPLPWDGFTTYVEGDIPYTSANTLVTNWSLDRAGSVHITYICIDVPALTKR
jgi:hypothetical protein